MINLLILWLSCFALNMSLQRRDEIIDNAPRITRLEVLLLLIFAPLASLLSLYGAIRPIFTFNFWNKEL